MDKTTEIDGIKIPKSAVLLTDEQMKEVLVKSTDEGCMPEKKVKQTKPKWNMKPISE